MFGKLVGCYIGYYVIMHIEDTLRCWRLLRKPNGIKVLGSSNPQFTTERVSLLMGALVTRAASCIIDPFRELICSPISTPLGLFLWSTIYHRGNKGSLCALLV